MKHKRTDTLTLSMVGGNIQSPKWNRHLEVWTCSNPAVMNSSFLPRFLFWTCIFFFFFRHEVDHVILAWWLIANSLNTSFINSVVQLFCLQLACKVWPKKSNKSPIKVSSHFHRWLKLSYLQVEDCWDKAHLLYGHLSMNYKLPVAGIEHLVEVCHIHSANKQFFGIGKV